MAASLCVLPFAASAQLATVVDPANAIQIAIAAGKYDIALKIAESAGASENDLTFVKGQILMARKKYTEAAETFREVLRVNPEARVARWNLVNALIQLERFDTALFQLDQLIATATSEAERDRFNAARRAVLKRRPYGFNFGLAFASSSNINRATQNTETPIFGGLTAAIDETEESGFGISINTGAYRRFEIADTSQLTFSTHLGWTGYSNPDYNRGYISGAISNGTDVNKGRRTISADIYRGLYRISAQNMWQLGASLDRELYTENIRYRFGARVSRIWYDDPGRRRSEYTQYRLSSLARAPVSKRTALTVGLSLTRNNSGDDRFSYIGLKRSFGAEHVWESGWSAGASAFLDRRSHDEIFGIGYAVPREDEVFGLDFSAKNNRLVILGFAPLLQCQLSRGKSNITIFDNVNVQECTFSLTSNF
ncbi:MAG: surface lipoprotein assembly modifier [Alphaproteobacteria bacterium]|nr:surface lipoprotein assembly modifier [Alphaproteobacteria bacterium]